MGNSGLFENGKQATVGGKGLRSDKVGKNLDHRKRHRSQKGDLSLILDKYGNIDILGARDECLPEDITLYEIS